MAGNAGESVNDNLIKSETLFDQEPGKTILEIRGHIVNHLITDTIFLQIMQSLYRILQKYL